jgi:hypothetical protein
MGGDCCLFQILVVGLKLSPIVAIVNHQSYIVNRTSSIARRQSNVIDLLVTRLRRGNLVTGHWSLGISH